MTVTVALRSEQSDPLAWSQVDGNFSGLATQVNINTGDITAVTATANTAATEAAEALTQIAALDVSTTVDWFASSTFYESLPAGAKGFFTPGTTTTLVLSNAYGTTSNVQPDFDGLIQGLEQFTLSGTSIIFDSAIPIGVENVHVKGGGILVANVPSNGSVGVPQLAADVLAYFATVTSLAAPTGDSSVGSIFSGSGAVATTVQEVLSRQYSAFACMTAAQKADVSSFTGSLDVTLAVEAVRTAVMIMGGGEIIMPAGLYNLVGVAGADGVVNGLHIPFTTPNNNSARVTFKGSGPGSTVLQCGSNNMILVRMSDSHCSLQDVGLSAGGKTGCTAHAVVPDNQTQTATVVAQSYNYSNNIYVTGGFQESIVLRCGPYVGSLASGCYYNTFSNYHIFENTRGIWLQSASQVNASVSTVNRNKFQNIRIGQTGSNTGVQIDAGNTNTFIGVDCEGISTGVSPNATPTGYLINNTDPSSGQSNNSNRFISCTPETCTRDLNNANADTELYGCGINGANSVFTAIPLIMMGGSDPSVTPQAMPGYRYQNAADFPGEDQGVMWLSGGFANGPLNYAYDQGFAWKTYAITPGICTNVTSVAEYHSKFQRLGGMVDWMLRFIFQATVAGTAVTIQLPLTPSTQYTVFNGQQPQFFPVTVVGATGQTALGYGQFSASSPGLITIIAPSFNWNAGPYSEIHLNLRYIETGF